jgi:hypothetical protein
MGTLTTELVPMEKRVNSIVGGGNPPDSKKIATRAGAFKRGGGNGKVVEVVMTKEHLDKSSPMRALADAGKVTRVSPGAALPSRKRARKSAPNDDGAPPPPNLHPQHAAARPNMQPHPPPAPTYPPTQLMEGKPQGYSPESTHGFPLSPTHLPTLPSHPCWLMAAWLHADARIQPTLAPRLPRHVVVSASNRLA